ncbi:MAG: YfhO family protein [Bacteroidaceae bacterium]
MKDLLKKIGPDAAVIAGFILISFLYFMTPVSQGLLLTGHDNTGGIGAGRELSQYNEQTGESTRWTNSLFCGMPTYQMAPSYTSRSILYSITRIYELGTVESMMFLFVSLLGFYILMRAFNFKVWLAALGAIIWAFSSYFFIIIAAGHLWKVMTLAFIPPTVAGMVLCYRGKLLWGGITTAFFVAFQIFSNHLQMTYYFLFVMGLMALAYLVQAIQEKQLPRFWKATAVLIIAAGLGVAANLSNLYHTYEYSKETMRGKSELVQTTNDGATQQNGLSANYITQWSYGIGETWSLLIPNVKGGASVPLANNEIAMKHADQQFAQIYSQLGQYWGDQPGTSGPVYVGAFVMLLFVLGIYLVKGPMKYALILATMVSLLFAWGQNIMPFTQLLIDHLPMYNKFRAVSSALVMAEFTIPLLAILALAEIVKNPDVLKKQKRWLYVSFALTGGTSLLFALLPNVFFSSFIPATELANLQQYLPADISASVISNLTEMRQAIFTADAWRSFWIISIGFVILLIYRAGKLKAMPMVLCLVVLCLVDMWQINKRYLNDNSFEEPWKKEEAFKKTPTDEAILQDKSLDYRVLNFASDTFNENTTSYWHKSIGGYHAAKLGRYQDLINRCIQPEMKATMNAISQAGGNMQQVEGEKCFPVLNMLNTKYFIFPMQNNETAPIQNPYANGNAWFVSELHYVTGANEEMAMLKTLNTKTTAVADQSFKEVLKTAVPTDSTSRVVLTKYEPNELTYQVNSKTGGIVVFSEIYYPGWTATIDGKPLEIGRVNYTLRGANVSKGNHTIVMTFKPESVTTTETIAYLAIIALLHAFFAGLYFSIWKKRKKK